MTGAASTLAEALKSVYTQCSKCETIFKLSAEVLRAAGGQVRCGKCGEVFSALARLAEDSAAFTTGESALELETRADSILESAIAPKVAREVAKDHEEYAPPGVEIAQLEVLDWTEEDQALQDRAQYQGSDAGPDDRSMEFTLPPGELDRIFIESKARAREARARRRAARGAGRRADDALIDVPIECRSTCDRSADRYSGRGSQADTPASTPPAVTAPDAPTRRAGRRTDAAPALPPHPESVAAKASPTLSRGSALSSSLRWFRSTRGRAPRHAGGTGTRIAAGVRAAALRARRRAAPPLS